ncbi:twin-arginine translocase subunit TatC [bacterium]|nr:twin-arginine translocase subunit TatC [bacterium]
MSPLSPPNGDPGREPLDQQADAGSPGPAEPAAKGESPPPGSGDGQMGFLDHLAELRSVLIHSGLAAMAATVLCWFVSARLLDLLISPLASEGVYFTAPNEAFLVRLKISGAVGIFVVLPFILFRVYAFILPGLYAKERKVVTPLLLTTTLLFYTGVAFAFLVVIPQVITFLMSFGTSAMEPLIGVGPYFGFVSRLCLAFGLVFELPLVVLFLSVIGIVNPRILLRGWRLAVILIFTASAMLTPPDVISQVMMGVPVLILYLGSVLVSIAVTRNKRKQD